MSGCKVEMGINVAIYPLGSIPEDDLVLDHIYAIYYLPSKVTGYVYIKIFENNKEPEDLIIMGFAELLSIKEPKEGIFHLILTGNGYGVFKLYTDIGVLDLSEELKNLLRNVKEKDAEEMLSYLLCIVADKMEEIYRGVERYAQE